MLIILLASISFFLILIAIYVVKEKELYNKILAFNQLNNLVILFIVSLSNFKYYNFYIDIAFIYALLSFIVSKALLQYSFNESKL